MKNKKNKSLKLLAAFLLAVIFAVSGCSGDGDHEITPGTTQVWSAYSGVKIMRDVTYTESERGAAALSVSMAQNELESVQLIMTADSKVSSYDLTAAALSDGAGNTIPVDDIFIYNQCYIEVGQKRSNMIYKPGWYPDALVPLANAKEYGDAVIAAGENQGLWVKFRTQKHTAAGTYTGNFTLDIDGAVSQIPVSVEVWDFEVTDDVNTKSAFLLYSDGMTMGEGDSTMEMHETYFEYFLEQRISLMNLPCELSDDSVVAAVRKYALNPKLSAYNIPYKALNGNINVSYLGKTIRAIVTASYEDGVNYLEKAYVYNLFTDEYSGITYKEDKVKVWIPAFNALRITIETEFDNNFTADYLNSVDGLRYSLQTITDLPVTHYVEKISNLTNAICPTFDAYQTQDERDFLRSKFDQSAGDELWWYGCIGPTYPCPTYHIDDNALSARLLSWMQYDYNIDGNLYYMVNQHFGDAGPLLFYPVDYYELAARNLGGGDVNGDGWLCYPGRRYGIKGPVGSLRLENIRDGLEEYEYLNYLEQLLEPLATAYGQPDMTVSNILRSNLDTLYEGVWATTSPELVQSVRETVAEAIIWARDYGVVTGGIRKDRDFVEADVYLPGGASLDTAALPQGTTVQETVQTGSGTMYTFRVMRVEDFDTELSFNFVLDGKALTFVKYLDAARRVLLTFDTADASKYTGVSANSPAPVLSEAGGVTAFKYELVSTTNALEALSFSPYIIMNSSFMKLIPSGTGSLTFELYNDGDTEVTVRFVRKKTGLEADDLVTTLPSKQWTQVPLPLVNIAEITSYRIYLPNRTDGVRQIIYLSKVYSGS